jgi:cell division protein FtsQ
MFSRKNRRRPDRAEQAAAVKGVLGRLLRGLFRLGLAAGLVAGSVYGFKAGLRWFTTSPTFAIDTVEVTGVQRLDTGAVRASSGLVFGTNIFKADLAEAQRAVEQNPWIHHVQVTRLLPRRISIQIEERKPVAQVALGALYLVDPDGELFKRVAPGDGVDLPLITGLSRQRFDSDPEEVRSEIARALSLLGELDQRRFPELSEIQLDPELGMTVYLGPESTAVKLGWGDIDAKLDRYQRTRAELERRQLKVSAVDLTDTQHPGRVGLSPMEEAGFAGRRAEAGGRSIRMSSH